MDVRIGAFDWMIDMHQASGVRALAMLSLEMARGVGDNAVTMRPASIGVSVAELHDSAGRQEHHCGQNQSERSVDPRLRHVSFASSMVSASGSEHEQNRNTGG